ncbi:MAG TPA: hypothetical protein VKU85_20865, partial [bacterium]|nr:hypothetical protein [bacterium]
MNRMRRTNAWRIAILTVALGTLGSSATASAQITETQLTTVGADRNPAWSPDGTEVLFDSDRSGNRDLWVIPVTGGTATRLTFNAGADIQPDWSPDGSAQVFSAVVGGSAADLYTRPSAGGPTVILDSDSGNVDGLPSWSPDSSLIAYVKGSDIYIIPAGGGTPVQLTTDPATDTHPTWSPDGSQIAFQSDRSGNVDVWVIPSSGGTATQLTFDPSADGSPDWSPDGSRIAFQSGRGGSNDIWVIPAGGGAAEQVTSSVGGEIQPDWAPGSTAIVFARASGLWIAQLPEVDIDVAKTVDLAMPNEGDAVVFTITTMNNGPDGAGGVEITDLLPPGLTYVSDVPSQGTYSSGTGIWSVDSLANGASATLDITATVGGGTAGSTLVNETSLSAVDQTDVNGANDADSASVTVQAVDLAVTKVVDVATPDEGDTVVYTVTALNGGPDAATGVEITDLLPAGVTYVSDVPSQGSYASGTGLWTVGAIAAADSAVLSITATVDGGTAGSSINNTASVTGSDQADTDGGNDSDSAGVTVQAIDLAVTKAVDDPAPNEGGSVVYTVTVLNGGPDTGTGVEITDLLPAGVTYVSDVPSQGSYASGTGLWTVGAIAAADSAVLSITASVDGGTAGSSINNTASVTGSDQTDTNGGNDSDSAGITVQAVDLAVTKAVDDPAPNEGGTVVYTVTVLNNGPDAASGVAITDLLPAGVTYVSDTASQGSYVSGTGLWTVGAIAAADSAVLSITASVDGGTAGTTVTNTASLTGSDQTDTNGGNDSDSAGITVQAIDLAVTKAVDDASPIEGASVVYTVTV